MAKGKVKTRKVNIEWEIQPRQITFLRACGLSHPFEDVPPGLPVARVIGYGGSAGGGKLLPLDTKIPTPIGWNSIGELKVGDELFSENGEVIRVTEVHGIELHPKAFKMVFDDGTEIISGAEHRWLTYSAKELSQLTRLNDEWRSKRRDRRKSRMTGNKSELFNRVITNRNINNPTETKLVPTGTIRTTEDIYKTIRTSTGRINHAIQIAKPLMLPVMLDLPIDPYLLGVWLGDGNSRVGRITTADEEIIRAFELDGYEVHEYYKYEYAIRNFTCKLRSNGLLKNKHIPQQYLRSSYKQRLALLQGLMDTDGTVNKHSGSVDFTTTNKNIADGVYELIVSLGWKVRLRQGIAKLNGRECGPKWTLKWTASEYVFRLKRKLKLQKLATRRVTSFRYIKECFLTESVAMRCITVDNPTGLYLIGNSMVPTHNSDALLMALIVACLTYPGISTGFFRREYTDLEGPGGAIMRSHELLAHWCHYNGTLRRWTFPKTDKKIPSSILEFCHAKHEKDVYSYQSQQFDVIAFDEATQFMRSMYRYMMTRNRATRAGVTPFIVLGTNPGNIGHVWFKTEFVDPGPPENVYNVEVEEGKFEKHIFIPAFLADNQVLEERDPQYRVTLENQTEDIRRQLLEGDWDVFAGQYYREWRRDIHVMEPFEIPKWWKRYRCLDYGLNRTACSWIAVSPDNMCYVYRELYESDLNLTQAAKKIISMTPVDEKISYTVASPDLWRRRQETGVSGIEIMVKVGLSGLTKAKHDRVMGWRVMREFLAPFEDEQSVRVARLRFFNNCIHAIRTIPALIHDENDIEDVSDRCEDDLPEALRYFVMSRAQPSIAPQKELSGVWHAGELRLKGYSDAKIQKLRKRIKIIGR